ncbi:MAG: VOC family protein [Ignavibacteriae bacterium]|nr:MAG: VOC family protein [Ignavibacteriota bacterium]
MKFEFSPYVAFQVKDYHKAVEFYEKVLGWNIIEKGEKESHFKIGPMNFFAENSPSGFTFFEFRTDNFEEARKTLEENGCVITQTYNDKSMMFKDPYGMCFHIFEE